MSHIQFSHSVFWLSLLLPAWLLTIYGARKLQVVIAHHCTHVNFSGHKLIDRQLGRAICIILWLRDFDSYQPDHIIHHKAKTALTLEDETVKFLYFGVGLRPGMPKDLQWRKLFSSLISPSFHFQLLKARLSACFLSTSLGHNFTAWGFWAIVFFLVSITNSWTTFLIAWLLPITVFYQVATCLRLAAEHKWPENITNRDKVFISRSTVAVFLGEPAPSPTLSNIPHVIQWTVWWFRMFCHLIVRLGVLQGDTPTHDYHTRYPGTDDWANALYARQQDLDAGCPHWPEPYTETWGLFSAIDGVLESLSQQPPMEDAVHATSSIYSAALAE